MVAPLVEPADELTIDEVMSGTGLSRPAFYVYFRDRHDLVLRLIGEIGSELFGMADKWLNGGDLRAGVEGVVAVYAKHFLRSLNHPWPGSDSLWNGRATLSTPWKAPLRGC